MIYFETEKKLIRTWLLIFVISIVIMLGLLYLSYSYLTGFLIGSVGSIISFIVNYFFVTKLLSKKRSQRLVIFTSLLRFIVIIGINISIILIVLYSNKFVGKINVLDGIFNFWTFLFGLSTSYIAIFVANMWNFSFKKTKLKKKGETNAS